LSNGYEPKKVASLPWNGRSRKPAKHLPPPRAQRENKNKKDPIISFLGCWLRMEETRKGSGCGYVW
ncbi:hypothetical protein Tco_1130651, partial [Tanacetum coccineum]